ncbi:26S proteasome regulatory subunit rpn6 [Coccomyxa viridis]|uniref:26S proteasome regulatory subunit rpn6 n=1 Tax=Coccomyxa viridis TaxID=1274662 RepID=A0AAV1I2N0_9CHLO|nr:26S proteasome regulatory subunit rpn6 [Coccomyxa viridis]
MAGSGLDESVASASKLPPEQAIPELRDVILGKHPNDAESIKAKEQAIQRLSDVYVKQKDAEALRKLLTELRPLFGLITKAKTAKIVRNIIEAIAKVPNSTQLQMEVCTEQVEWAKAEKRTFLRQRIEARLANLYLSMKDYSSALALISRLLTEVKRLDDKLLLLDIHLLESRTHHALKNLPKAKAALTASRTAANAIYVPPSSQAEIDMQSGTLHAEEKDYKTAYSYFFEAFEALSSLDDPKATLALKYMLLSKVMMKDADEVPGLVSSKAGLKHAGQDVDSMIAVAKAYKERSLQGFQAALAAYRAQLVEDPIVHAHLSQLYDTLLEGNLARLIEPFSCVEISHLAELIKLPQELVLNKLSQMILDKKFSGTLDQGAGCLEVFEDGDKDGVYPAALDTFSNMGRVIDSLFLRSQKIMA